MALLAAGYKDLDEGGGESGTSTPLILSALNGLESSVKALLAAGANKDARNKVSCCYMQDVPLMADVLSYDT